MVWYERMRRRRENEVDLVPDLRDSGFDEKVHRKELSELGLNYRSRAREKDPRRVGGEWNTTRSEVVSESLKTRLCVRVRLEENWGARLF